MEFGYDVLGYFGGSMFTFGGVAVGENEMSYQFIYDAIFNDPRVKRQIEEINEMIRALERYVEELRISVETLRALANVKVA